MQVPVECCLLSPAPLFSSNVCPQDGTTALDLAMWQFVAGSCSTTLANLTSHENVVCELGYSVHCRIVWYIIHLFDIISCLYLQYSKTTTLHTVTQIGLTNSSLSTAYCAITQTK